MLMEISKIITDAGTQNRPDCDATAALYAERMTEGDVFPEISVASVYSGKDRGIYLIDGFTRLEAYIKNGVKEVEVKAVTVASKEEAIWMSFSANKANGRQRTAFDITNILRRVFLEPEFTAMAGLSLREIAAHIGCSHEMVRKVKAQCTVTSIKEEVGMGDVPDADIVADKVATAFDVASQVTAICKTIEGALDRIDKLPALGTELMDLGACSFQLTNTMEHIKNSVPFKPCPNCEGDAECYICAGRGWVTKKQHLLYKENRNEKD